MRRTLQILNGAVGMVTAILGGMQLGLGAASPVYDALGGVAPTALDSNLRFFGGMALALGALMLWVVPRIERRTVAYRIFWLCAFVGGVGRLVSLLTVGAPPDFMLGITVLEVAGAPAFVYAQHRLAREA